MKRLSNKSGSGGILMIRTGKKRPGVKSIPRSFFQGAALTLSTPLHRWLSEEVWGETEINYFYSNWPAPQSGMHLYPAFAKPQHNRQKLVFLGRWTLSETHGVMVSAVEVEGLISSFTQLSVRIGPLSHVEGWTSPTHAEALAHLVSALIMIHKADFIRLIPTTDLVSKQLEQLGWGTKSFLWSPDLAYLSRPRMVQPASLVQIRAIDPEAWWETAEGEKSHRALSYLEKRMSLTASQEQACESRRLGLFQRLGRLLRWS